MFLIVWRECKYVVGGQDLQNTLSRIENFHLPWGFAFASPQHILFKLYTNFTFQFPHQRYKIVYIWKTMNELVPTVGLNGQKPKKGEAESV